MKKYIDSGKKDTRSGFGAGLLKAGEANPRVVALTADLKGSLKMDAFAAAFPERFFQLGRSVLSGSFSLLIALSR